MSLSNYSHFILPIKAVLWIQTSTVELPIRQHLEPEKCVPLRDVSIDVRFNKCKDYLYEVHISGGSTVWELKCTEDL